RDPRVRWFTGWFIRAQPVVRWCEQGGCPPGRAEGARASAARVSGDLWFALKRDLHVHGRPFSGLAFGQDPTAVGLDDLPGNGETEARAPGPAVVSDLVILIDDVGGLLVRDPDPGIGHGDPERVAGRDLDADLPALGCELERIGEEVPEDLVPDEVRVDHHGGRCGWIDLDGEVDSFLDGEGAERALGFLEEWGDG